MNFLVQNLWSLHKLIKHNLWSALIDGLIDNDKNPTQKSRLEFECKNHTLFKTKIAKIRDLPSIIGHTKRLKKPQPFKAAHNYIHV